MNTSNHAEDIQVHDDSTSFHSWPIIGHEWAVATLANAINTDCLRHAYLITGAPGIGKYTLATAFIQALLCSEAISSCGECRTCSLVAHCKHPDVEVITPVVSGKIIKTGKIAIEPIRKLIYRFSLRPVEAARRIAIISGFEAVTEPAANALLKTLEEPPGDGLLILIASSADRLLPTIVSRCEQIALRPLSRHRVNCALTERWRASAEHAELLAHLSAGRLGWAVNMLTDTDALERRSIIMDDMFQLLAGSRVARFAYAERLYKDREVVLETLDLWLSWWRDILLITSGASTLITNIDREIEVRSVAGQLSSSQAAEAVAAIYTACEQLAKNANTRLAIDVLMLALPRIDASEHSPTVIA